MRYNLFIKKKINPIRYEKIGIRYIKFQYQTPEHYYEFDLQDIFVYNSSKTLLKCFKNKEEYLEDRFVEEMRGAEVQEGLAREIPGRVKIR